MRNNYKTDALARCLTLRPYAVDYRPQPEMTAADIERETARLDALPADEQLLVFCKAMGFPPLEYLVEKAKFVSEAEQGIEWLDTSEMGSHGAEVSE